MRKNPPSTAPAKDFYEGVEGEQEPTICYSMRQSTPDERNSQVNKIIKKKNFFDMNLVLLCSCLTSGHRNESESVTKTHYDADMYLFELVLHNLTIFAQ